MHLNAELSLLSCLELGLVPFCTRGIWSESLLSESFKYRQCLLVLSPSPTDTKEKKPNKTNNPEKFQKTIIRKLLHKTTERPWALSSPNFVQLWFAPSTTKERKTWLILGSQKDIRVFSVKYCYRKLRNHISDKQILSNIQDKILHWLL